MSSRSASRLLPFIFVFVGSYVASYLFFFLPVLLPAGTLGFISIIVALPSLYYLSRWTGLKTALLVFVILSGMVIIIEGFGVLSGFPYGSFFYTDLTGFKLFGVVPWTIAFAFIPLLLGIFVIILNYFKTLWKVVLLTALLLMCVDLVLDPVYVYLGIWIWITPGIYYGVPLSNFGGWIFTGLITAFVLFALLQWKSVDSKDPPIFIALSLILTLAFWSGYILWAGLVIPFALSVILLGFFVFSVIRFWPTD
jgi:putative membrane protein